MADLLFCVVEEGSFGWEVFGEEYLRHFGLGVRLEERNRG